MKELKRAWETSDGSIFKSLSAAEEHEATLCRVEKVHDWVHLNLCHYDNTSLDIAKAILENRDQLLEILQ